MVRHAFLCKSSSEIRVRYAVLGMIPLQWWLFAMADWNQTPAALLKPVCATGVYLSADNVIIGIIDSGDVCSYHTPSLSYQQLLPSINQCVSARSNISHHRLIQRSLH